MVGGAGASGMREVLPRLLGVTPTGCVGNGFTLSVARAHALNFRKLLNLKGFKNLARLVLYLAHNKNNNAEPTQQKQDVPTP